MAVSKEQELFNSGMEQGIAQERALWKEKEIVWESEKQDLLKQLEELKEEVKSLSIKLSIAQDPDLRMHELRVRVRDRELHRIGRAYGRLEILKEEEDNTREADNRFIERKDFLEKEKLSLKEKENASEEEVTRLNEIEEVLDRIEDFFKETENYRKCIKEEKKKILDEYPRSPFKLSDKMEDWIKQDLS